MSTFTNKIFPVLSFCSLQAERGLPERDEAQEQRLQQQLFPPAEGDVSSSRQGGFSSSDSGALAGAGAEGSTWNVSDTFFVQKRRENSFCVVCDAAFMSTSFVSSWHTCCFSHLLTPSKNTGQL